MSAEEEASTEPSSKRKKIGEGPTDVATVQKQTSSGPEKATAPASSLLSAPQLKAKPTFFEKLGKLSDAGTAPSWAFASKLAAKKASDGKGTKLGTPSSSFTKSESTSSSLFSSAVSKFSGGQSWMSTKSAPVVSDVAAQTKPFLWGKNEGATTGFKWSSGANVKCVNPSIMRNSDGDEEAMQKNMTGTKSPVTKDGTSTRGSFTLLQAHTGEEDEDCVKSITGVRLYEFMACEQRWCERGRDCVLHLNVQRAAIEDSAGKTRRKARIIIRSSVKNLVFNAPLWPTMSCALQEGSCLRLSARSSVPTPGTQIGVDCENKIGTYLIRVHRHGEARDLLDAIKARKEECPSPTTNATDGQNDSYGESTLNTSGVEQHGGSTNGAETKIRTRDKNNLDDNTIPESVATTEISKQGEATDEDPDADL